MVTLTGFFCARSSWKPAGIAIPADPEWAARYCEKLTPAETDVIVIVFVAFRALMKPWLAVELLSLFWTYTGTVDEPLPEKIAPKRSIRMIGNMSEKKRPIRLR